MSALLYIVKRVPGGNSSVALEAYSWLQAHNVTPLSLPAGDKQGVLGNACDVQPPPASCTATGGSYHSFRHPTGRKKTSASIMIFFSPSSEASLQPQFAGINATVDSCSVATPASPTTIARAGTHLTGCSLLEDPDDTGCSLECHARLPWSFLVHLEVAITASRVSSGTVLRHTAPCW